MIRVAHTVIDDEEALLLCDDINISAGDFVYVEGYDKPCKITCIEEAAEGLEESSLKRIAGLSEYVGDMEVNPEDLSIFARINKELSYASYHLDALMRINEGVNITEHSLIQEISITNKSKHDLYNLVLEITFASDILSVEPIYINTLDALKKTSYKIPLINVDRDKLEEVSEKVATSIRFTLKNNLGNVILSEEYLFKLLPISEPSIYASLDYRMYAKYVTPSDPGVKQITLDAVKNNNGKSFIAYQNGYDYKAMIGEIEAIYRTLHNYGIQYQNPPAGGLYEIKKDGSIASSQRIRMPYEVLRDRKGTCLDLSILMCSVLEEIMYHPILVMMHSHAFVGVFLNENNRFLNGIDESVSRFYNNASPGSPELVLIDATALNASDAITFKASSEAALSRIKEYSGIFKALDINTLHKTSFSPIPLKGSNERLTLSVSKDISKDLVVISSEYATVRREMDKDRFTFWEKRLLDLTEANPLVSYKMRPTNTVYISSSKPITDILADKDSIKLKEIDYKASQSDVLENIFRNGYDTKALGDDICAIGLEKTLKNIIRKSDSAMEETGSPTLYLCLGSLIYERKNKATGIAPFMVLPVKISKDKMLNSYTMRYDYDDLMINQTFFEYYKIDHPDASFDHLYKVDSEYKYMDYVSTFKKYSNENIRLDSDTCFLANLTFSHYIMWMDVRKRKEELKKNKIIDSIIKNTNTINEPLLSDNIDADEVEKYSDFAAPLPYDSTQLKAILDCGAGKSFILDGPPGTGKSQTIVNMIVNAFYHGKTVLFVAEKKAALDVVADRLSKIELGRFCLELHSNKASKSSFFGRIKESMELGITKEPLDYDKKCLELNMKKAELLRVINRLHEKKYNMSLYDAILRSEELKDIYGEYVIEAPFLIELDDNKRDEINNLISEYVRRAHSIRDFKNNPLKAFKLEEINYSSKNEVAALFSNALDKYSKYKDTVDALVGGISLEFLKTQRSLGILFKMLDLVFNKDLYMSNILEYLNSNDNLDEIFERSISYNKLKKEMSLTFDISKLSMINAKEMLDEYDNTTGFFKRRRVISSQLKKLKRVSLDKLSKKMVREYLTNINEYNDSYDYISANARVVERYCEKQYLENIDNAITIRDNYYNTKQMASLIKDMCDYAFERSIINYFVSITQNKDMNIRMDYNMALSAYENYKEYEDIISNSYKLDYSFIQSTSDEFEYYRSLLSYAANPDNFNDLINVANLNKIGNRFSEYNMSMFLDDICKSLLDVDMLKDAFDKALASNYINLYFIDDDINYFLGLSVDDSIKEYKRMISEYSSLCIEEVSARLSRKLNTLSRDYAQSSPIGRLKKSILNNGRGVTIRDTLLNFNGIIKSYFPCFLMSPLSAAQYLAVDGDKSSAKFDIVIFDEASQIPTHEAVGPIARGKSLIVAGDPEQMPPSAYFSAGVDLEGSDVEFEDAESLLDECLAIELPRHRLKFHYRSKHESLINFSNHNFYQDNLYTFPSTKASESMVSFKHVALREMKKDSSITLDELNAILNTFRDIYRDPITCKKSVGIIVFNIKQRDAVLDAVAEMLEHDKELQTRVMEAEERTKEPWFVKSLENVQGDERDIIILSIGFRKSVSNKPVVNGPLARENGQRRLNVAVSRSKEKMYVISTIRYSDFQESQALSKGPRLLKEFLRYAEGDSLDILSSSTSDSSLSLYIKEDLERLGYVVDMNVGSSMYKVDLAIKDKNTNEYVLGILVDSNEMSSDTSLRDRLYVREMMLNSLKWKTVNVYSIDYYKDKKMVLDKIVGALDNPYIKEELVIDPNIVKTEVKLFDYDQMPYTRVNISSVVSYDNQNGYDININKVLRNIVIIEGPVSFETIKKKVRDCSNIKVMSSKATQRLYDLLSGYNYTEDQEQRFYWISGNTSHKVDRFRVDSGLDIFNISKEEIACAMRQILKLEGSVNPNDLFHLTLNALKCETNVLNSNTMTRLLYVYEWALANGKLD